MSVKSGIVFIAASDGSVPAPTHDVRFRTTNLGYPANWSHVHITAVHFDADAPSSLEVEEKLRRQLGIEDERQVQIVSVGPFSGWTAKA